MSDNNCIICIGPKLAELEGLTNEQIRVAKAVDAALALVNQDVDVVLLDLREHGNVTDFRRLRQHFPGAYLLGLADTSISLQQRWDATKAGCDDFISVPMHTLPQELTQRLQNGLTVSQTRKCRILVVDDDHQNRDMVRQDLEDARFVVLEAGDASSAFLLGPSADLIVLDILMPDMDGREVCRRLRTDPRCRNTPIVMLSILTEIGDKLQALDMGANDYVTKPYNAEQLVTKIKRLLWLRRAQEQLEKSIQANP